MSIKRDLLNYLEFLQQSGFLYVEGVDAGELIAPLLRPKPAPAMPAKPASPPPPPPPPAAPVRPQRTAPPAVSPRVVATPTPTPPPPPRPPAPPGPPLPTGPLSRDERIARLNDAAARAEACRACELGTQRKRLVFGAGDPMAAIVFVGEAPGAEEDESGLPFVGRSGQLLEKMIEAIGFRRDEVYICNTIKCRPPINRDPFPAEKTACEHFLVEQLAIVRPKILVALGAHAAQSLCRSEAPIGKLRGQWHAYHGIPLLATFHPSYLLRSPGQKPKSWEDFQTIHAKYCELAPDDPRTLWSKKEE